MKKNDLFNDVRDNEMIDVNYNYRFKNFYEMLNFTHRLNKSFLIR